MAIRIFLVEDHEIVRQGTRALLNEDPEMLVVGEAVNGKEALLKLQDVPADVVLMDMNMPEMNGKDCTIALKSLYPEIKVLILSMHDHENYLIDMLEAGADGYILKSSNKEELLFAIRKVASNGIYMAPEFTLNLLSRLKKEKEEKAIASDHLGLTDRERDLIELIAEGLTNQEIAATLYSSVRTVENRRKKILEKTGTKNTASLIRFAVSNGLIK